MPLSFPWSVVNLQYESGRSRPSSDLRRGESVDRAPARPIEFPCARLVHPTERDHRHRRLLREHAKTEHAKRFAARVRGRGEDGREKDARGAKREGLLQTEHAVLDDNGDKAATQTPSLTEPDGKVASILSLGTIGGTTAPSDPKLAALYAERRDLERRVENLRLLKDNMDPAKYNAELARLATELARKTQEIRAAEQ